MTRPASTTPPSASSEISPEDTAHFGTGSPVTILLKQGYFAEPRRPIDIRRHWAAVAGRILRQSSLAGALRSAVVRGNLRPVKLNGRGFHYCEVDLTQREDSGQLQKQEPIITPGQAAALHRATVYATVIELGSSGKTRAEIAATVGITMRTVSRYFSKARRENQK
jgi:hypothetical protein